MTDDQLIHRVRKMLCQLKHLPGTTARCDVILLLEDVQKRLEAP